MSSVNKVFLLGNLGADPELKHLPSGDPVCELRLATNEAYTDKQGEKHERVEWHRVVVWGKMAEACGQYLAKGRQVFVEGKIQTRQWEDRDGNKRYMTEIRASAVQFLGGGQQDGGSALGDADSAMGDAGSRLGQGNADSAADAQGRALEALRKGAQNLAQSMQPGEGQDGSPGNRMGRAQNSGPSTDPLGRPLSGREWSDDLSVKIPGEIDVQRVRRILEELRRRLADPQRPQIELDYIERLLKDY